MSKTQQPLLPYQR
jgi:hypothetical protein